jgi:hypothetical protein
MSFLHYQTKDYYQVLKVSETATLEEIKKSFFHLAKLYHPDVNHAPDAADRFKEINEAFHVIGNPEERKIYDTIRSSKKITSDHFAKSAAPSPVSSAREGEEPSPSQKQEIHSYRRKLIIAAITRIILLTLSIMLISYLYVVIIHIIVWTQAGVSLLGDHMVLNPLFAQNVLLGARAWGGILAGLIIGVILGIDFNFKIETFINNLFMKKTYHFLRTLLFTFAFAYLFSLLGLLFTSLLKTENITLKISLILIGLLIGSTISSDGNFPVRIKSAQGGKELIFIMIRNLGFGLIGSVLGLFFTFIIGKSFEDPFIWYIPLTGFALLTAMGTTSEEEISTLIKEIDEGTKKIVFIVLLLIAFAFGVGIGILLGKTIH